MLDIMFELPEQGAGRRYVVTPEVVNGQTAAVRRQRTETQVGVTFKPGAARMLSVAEPPEVKLRP